VEEQEKNKNSKDKKARRRVPFGARLG